MVEKDIVEKIKKALGEKYPRAFVYKTHGSGFQRAGLPDLMGCIDGTMIAIEVKQPGREDTLTRIQQVTLKQLHKAGAITFMTTSVEHTLKLISQGLAGHPVNPLELIPQENVPDALPRKRKAPKKPSKLKRV